MSTKTCECHKIDWSKGSNKYIHIPSDEVYDTNKHGLLHCKAKVSGNKMTIEEYYKICNYTHIHLPIFEKDNTHLLNHYVEVNDNGTGIEEGIPPISTRSFPKINDNYIKHN